MVNEDASARVFAGLLPQLMAAGVSAARQRDVVGFAAKELRHGVQCAAAVHTLGGEACAGLPDLPPVPAHVDVPPLEFLSEDEAVENVSAVVSERWCTYRKLPSGESSSVPCAGATRMTTTSASPSPSAAVARSCHPPSSSQRHLRLPRA
jgi:hypothetical protein